MATRPIPDGYQRCGSITESVDRFDRPCCDSHSYPEQVRPTLLTKRPHALFAWPFLIAIAAAGLIRGPRFTDASIGVPAVALFAAPLAQSALFVILYRGFVAFGSSSAGDL